MDISQRFEMFDDEYGEFDRVLKKRSGRPDLHAFVLLDTLFPGVDDMVCYAEHDEIWLDISGDNIANLSDDEILELVRCGVRYDDDNDSLCMFV
jgi:hypothetical protein